jgi:hypothetical protein
MPKRAKILGRPSNASDKRRLIVLAILVLVLVAAGVALAFWSWQRPSVMPAAVPVMERESQYQPRHQSY